MSPEDLGAYYESILEKEVRKAGGIYDTLTPVPSLPPPKSKYTQNG